MFQLKTHKYLYAEIPRQVIDEESHPGVFVGMMGSLASSTSSDSDGDSNTGGSHISRSTTGRVRRALRRGRRRTSSSTDDRAVGQTVTDQPSGAAGIRSVSGDHQSNMENLPGHGAPVDVAGEHGATAGTVPSLPTQVRDFEAETRGSKPSAQKAMLGKTGGSRNSQGNRGRKEMERRDITTGATAPNKDDGNSDQRERSRLPFFGQRSMRPNVRPTLPKLLSNNVFTTPSSDPVVAQEAQSQRPTRASSLPHRLDRTQSAAGTSSGPRPNAGPNGISHDAPKSDADGEPDLSRAAAIVLLVVITGLVAICGESLVGAIPEMIEQTTISQAFVGLIILPIVGNVAEAFTAIKVAAKNNMDLAIGVAIGSSIQIGEIFSSPVSSHSSCEGVYRAGRVLLTSSCSPLRHSLHRHPGLVPVQGNVSLLQHLRDGLALRDDVCAQLPRSRRQEQLS